MLDVQTFEANGETIVYLIKGGSRPGETSFVTPSSASLQVGFIVKTPDDVVPRHDHHPIERTIVGTAEVLVVLSGGGEMEVFSPDRESLGSVELGNGDVVVLLAGGHGFTFSEDTILLEVKQGPYPGIDEKERF